MSGWLSSAAPRPLRAASASLLRSATPRPRHVLRCIPLAPGRPDRPSNGPPSPAAAAAAAAPPPLPQPPAQAHHLPRPRPARPGPLARRRGQQQAAGQDPPLRAAERGQTAHRIGSPRPVGRVPSFRPSPPLPPVPYRSAAAEAARPAAPPRRRTSTRPPARPYNGPAARPPRPHNGPAAGPGRARPLDTAAALPCRPRAGRDGLGIGHSGGDTLRQPGSPRPGSARVRQGEGAMPAGKSACVGAEELVHGQLVRRRGPLCQTGKTKVAPWDEG